MAARARTWRRAERDLLAQGQCLAAGQTRLAERSWRFPFDRAHGQAGSSAALLLDCSLDRPHARNRQISFFLLGKWRKTTLPQDAKAYRIGMSLHRVNQVLCQFKRDAIAAESRSSAARPCPRPPGPAVRNRARASTKPREHLEARVSVVDLRPPHTASILSQPTRPSVLSVSKPATVRCCWISCTSVCVGVRPPAGTPRIVAALARLPVGGGRRRSPYSPRNRPARPSTTKTDSKAQNPSTANPVKSGRIVPLNWRAISVPNRAPAAVE